MQQTRVTIFKRPLLWLGAALVVAAAVVTERPANHRISYVRYVSPARLDGTRCTFLYPATIGQPIVSGAVVTAAGKLSQVQGITAFSRISSSEALIQRFGILRRTFPVNTAEISIVSEDDPAQSDPFPTRLVVSENPRYIKSESSRIGECGGEHDIILKDKLSHVKYDFEYICWLPNTGDSSASELASADATISESFQALPPGAAAPADTPK